MHVADGRPGATLWTSHPGRRHGHPASIPGHPPTPIRPASHTLRRLPVAIAAAIILVATLTPGSAERLEPTQLTCLVCGSAGGADVIRNVLLFLPLGAAAAFAGVRWRTAVGAGFLLSLSVEAMQYFVVVGRDPSLSDLTTNTIGTALGHAIVATWATWATPSPTVARRLLAAGTVAWAALLGATAAGLQWDAPPLPYVTGVVPPRFAGVREYEGAVYRRTLNGQPVTRRDDGTELAGSMREGRVQVGAEVGVMYPPGLLRPVVGFYRRDWSAVLTFGQQRRDLVLNLRTRSQRARLGGPRWVLHDVFPDLETAYSPAGRAMRVAIEGVVAGPSVQLTAYGGAAGRSVVLGRRLSLGWTFFLPPLALLYRLVPLAGALWLAAPLLPLAYWARRGVVDRREGWRAAGLLAVGTVVLVAGVAAVGGLAQPSAVEWVVLAGAGVTGWWLGGKSRAAAGDGT